MKNGFDTPMFQSSYGQMGNGKETESSLWLQNYGFTLLISIAPAVTVRNKFCVEVYMILSGRSMAVDQ